MKEFHILEFFQHLDYLNSNFKLGKPRTIKEFSIYLLKLIFITQSKLKLQSIGESNKEQNSENQFEKEQNGLIDYLRNLSTEKLSTYKDKLDQTIKKLNNDLVDQLEIRDTNHLKKDDLFRKIEVLTKSRYSNLNLNFISKKKINFFLSLQIIKFNELNQNPKI